MHIPAGCNIREGGLRAGSAGIIEAAMPATAITADILLDAQRHKGRCPDPATRQRGQIAGSAKADDAASRVDAIKGEAQSAHCKWQAFISRAQNHLWASAASPHRRAGSSPPARQPCQGPAIIIKKLTATR